MKKILFILLIASSLAFAQFRDENTKPINIGGAIGNNSPSSFLLGFINPQNFQMNHSISMSYSAFGGQGIAMGIYTNNMSYKFSDDLNVEADISFVNSPYSSFGEDHAKQLGGIYLSRAQLNYNISNNFKVTLQYNQIPNSYYSPYGYSRYSPFGYYRNDWLD